ncbi:MAG: hypothetical protein RM338_33630 [Nostoc sp. DedQUE12a]|nr:hypothetical protein [Nostoc sp. DedQUE12a]
MSRNRKFNIANITDWSVINTGNPGVFNLSSSLFDFVPDGVQTLYSNGATAFQTLSTVLAPKTLYTLGVSVGRRRDFTDFPGFSVELRAGGTLDSQRRLASLYNAASAKLFGISLLTCFKENFIM